MPKVIAHGVKATGQVERDNWLTPSHIMQAVNDFFFGDYFDPCPANPTFNGLELDWDTVRAQGLYINPPFSQYLAWSSWGMHFRKEQLWMCHHSHDTRWMQMLLKRSAAICMLNDRVKFLDPVDRKPKGTAFGKCQSLIYIGKRDDAFKASFSEMGLILRV
jgi:hypothetical protein